MILRICLMTENRRRDRLSQEQYDSESAVHEPCDWVSSWYLIGPPNVGGQYSLDKYYPNKGQQMKKIMFEFDSIYSHEKKAHSFI